MIQEPLTKTFFAIARHCYEDDCMCRTVLNVLAHVMPLAGQHVWHTHLSNNICTLTERG